MLWLTIDMVNIYVLYIIDFFKVVIVFKIMTTFVTLYKL